MIKSMLARLELNNSLAPIQEYGRHQKRAGKIKKKEAPKKKPEGQPAGEGEDQNATTADAGSGEKEKPKDFQDDKFYDLDDAWIDDGDVDCHDDLGDEIHMGDGTSAFFTENIVEDSGPSIKNVTMTAEGEDQESRLYTRKMKKEQERIARKFKVITPAEFDAAVKGSANTAQNGRPAENDSWC